MYQQYDNSPVECIPVSPPVGHHLSGIAQSPELSISRNPLCTFLWFKGNLHLLAKQHLAFLLSKGQMWE